MFDDLFEIFPRYDGSPYKDISNDKYLILLIVSFHIFLTQSQFRTESWRKELKKEYVIEIKMAILQCSAEELMKVAKIICQDGKADPSEWRIRLSNFALTLFSEVKII